MALALAHGRLCFTCVSVLLQVWVANLEHSRVSTCSLYASPAGLSPYLRFGCLSCRLLYYSLRELYIKVRHIPPFDACVDEFLSLYPSVSLSCVKAAVPPCLCLDSCCGGSSSTRRPPTTPTLTAWRGTPSVSRWVAYSRH